jgi:hemin uptake protein HemP
MSSSPVTDTGARPGDRDLPAVPSAGPPRVESRHLFAGGPEVLIAHEGEQYRLRITRQGKLILTK